jgi:type II secretory pathway pseudopilin PulG
MTMESTVRRWPVRGRFLAQQGITLIEASLVLMITAILVAVAAPVTSRSLDSARLTRAQSDADAIGTAIHNFITEFTGFVPFTTTGLAGGTTVQMLVSDGDIAPRVFPAGSTLWTQVVDPAAASPVDFLERHLVTNNPSGTGAYTTAGVAPWRGAYVNGPLDPDPWGNRYMVNVLHLRTTTTNDTFVLSAGPDEQISSAFTVNGATPGADDIISIIRRDPGLVVP